MSPLLRSLVIKPCYPKNSAGSTYVPVEFFDKTLQSKLFGIARFRDQRVIARDGILVTLYQNIGSKLQT